MKLSEIKSSAVDRNAEIIDAASALGTAKELTPAVRARVEHHLGNSSLVTMNDADLENLIAKANNEEKFAIKIACKVRGRRLPEDLREGKSQARKLVADYLESMRSEIPSYLKTVSGAATEEKSLKQVGDLKKYVKGKVSDAGHSVTWKYDEYTLKLAFMVEPFEQGEKTAREDGKIAWQIKVSGPEEFTVVDHDRSRSLIGALSQLSLNMKKG